MKRKAWAILCAFLRSSIVCALATARSGSNSSEKYSCAACLRSSSLANSLLIPASSPASSQKPAHLGHSSTRTPRFTLWKWRIIISSSLGQWMRLLRSGWRVESRSTSRNFSPADSFASSTRASSNQSNQIPPHPPAHTSTVTPSASLLVMVLEHTGHSITRSSLASGSRVVSVILVLPFRSFLFCPPDIVATPRAHVSKSSDSPWPHVQSRVAAGDDRYTRVGPEVLWEDDEVVPEPGRRRDEETLEAVGVSRCSEGLRGLVVGVVHQVSHTQAE